MSRFVRDPDWIVRDVGGQQVLVPISAPMPKGVFVFSLEGPVARLIWDALAEPRSTAELLTAVQAEFEVTAEQAQAELATYLEHLERLGAIRAA